MTFVALITGASSGIGEATARRLPSRVPDADIIVVARREDRLQALAGELNARDFGGRRQVHPYAADLTDPDQVAALADHVQTTFGKLDLLVNNAGARWSSDFAAGGWANIAETMEINFEAPVRLTEALLPALRAAHGAAVPTASSTATPAPTSTPSIVNVASTAGRVARSGTSAYSASKFAMIGWTDAIHHELAAEGIHVGLVNPGFVVTEGFPQAELAASPLKRHLLGTTEQVADAILTAGLDGRAEVYVPRFYWGFAVLRILAPGVIRRAVGSGGLTPRTARDTDPGATS